MMKPTIIQSTNLSQVNLFRLVIIVTLKRMDSVGMNGTIGTYLEMKAV